MSPGGPQVGESSGLLRNLYTTHTLDCSYGFTNVIIPSDIYHSCPAFWPFSSPFARYHASAARPLELPIYKPTDSGPPTQGRHLRIESVFVYNDPRDFGLDTQVVLDLLLSHKGFLGTRSKLNGCREYPNNGYQQDDQPPLTFANPDMFWAAQFHLPRLGSGAFQAALQGLWRAVTGRAELQVQMGGKPSAQTFQFAEERLIGHRAKLLEQRNRDRGAAGELRRVYMVGDNPASDIVGANNFKSSMGIAWLSILVRSGVFAGEPPPEKDFRPRETVDDVLDAVNWALEQEGQERIQSGGN